MVPSNELLRKHALCVFCFRVTKHEDVGKDLCITRTLHQNIMLWLIHVDVWQKPTQYYKANKLIKKKP